MKILDYNLTIQTDDKWDARTYDAVYITVFGKINGKEVSTEEINLSSEIKDNSVKEIKDNSVKKSNQHNFTFRWQDIGRPRKIKLRLCNHKYPHHTGQLAWCKIARMGSEEIYLGINREVKFMIKEILLRGEPKVFYGVPLY
jgi:hypothetical protein